LDAVLLSPDYTAVNISFSDSPLQKQSITLGKAKKFCVAH